MKITVITDKAGKVVGTAHHGIRGSRGRVMAAPSPGPSRRFTSSICRGSPKRTPQSCIARFRAAWVLAAGLKNRGR